MFNNVNLDALVEFQRLSEQIRINQDPEEVASALFRVLHSFTHYKQIGLFFFLDKRGEFLPIGPGSSEIIERTNAMREEGIIDWALEQSKPITLPSPARIDFHNRYPGDVLLFPLFIGEEKLGILILVFAEGAKRLPRHEELITSLLAAQAAIAVKHGLDYLKNVRDKQKLTRLIETLQDVIFTTDRDGIITFINRRVEIFGTKPEQLVGHPLYTLIPFEADQGQTIKLLRHGKAFHYDTLLSVSEKSDRWFHIDQVPLEGVSGEQRGCLGIMRDITEQRHLEQQILRTERKAALEEASISLNHEINNPLSVIQGNLYLLEKCLPLDDNPKAKKALDILQHHTRRIAEIVKQLNQVQLKSRIRYQGSVHMIDLRDGMEKEIDPPPKQMSQATGDSKSEP